MHDLFEGIIPVQIELMLRSHASAGLYAVVELNEFLASRAPVVSGKNRPNGIISTDIQLVGKQTSSQIVCLTQVISFFMLELEEELNEHWHCMSLLIRIVQLTFSPVCDDVYVHSLRETIRAHHDSFIQIYPHRFIPKLEVELRDRKAKVPAILACQTQKPFMTSCAA